MKSKRFDLFFILFLAAMVFFVYRLYGYQVKSNDKYVQQVENISLRSTRTLSTRGSVLDRYSTPLAWDAPIYTVRKKVVFLADDLKRTVIDGFEDRDKAESFLKRLEMYGSVETDLPIALAERLKEYPELEVSERIIRYYAENPGLAHVLGYLRGDGEAVMGAEKQYNDLLTGTPGEKVIRVDSRGNTVAVESESSPLPGNNVVLTIDAQLSRFAYDRLLATGKNGAAVVMKTNGEVLALVSVPSFNNNLFSRRISDRDWLRMNLDPSTPLINRAISPFSPGSVIKPFIAMVALAERYDPSIEVSCGGSFQYKNTSGEVQGIYRDWFLYGHGVTGLSKAITVSCNVYFYQLGLELEIETMNVYGKKWGIFEPTGIDLPGEGTGLLPSPAWKKEKTGEGWFPGDTILTSIGQGYLSITPLQLARMTAEIAIRGAEVLPFICRERSSERVVIDLNEESWDLMINAMKDVISKGGAAAESGTAYTAFRNFQWPVAGKTGTAEQGGSLPTHSWFTGFTPVEDPEIVVSVFVQDGGYGSGLASEVSRDIMEFYYENRNR